MYHNNTSFFLFKINFLLFFFSEYKYSRTTLSAIVGFIAYLPPCSLPASLGRKIHAIRRRGLLIVSSGDQRLPKRQPLLRLQLETGYARRTDGLFPDRTMVSFLCY